MESSAVAVNDGGVGTREEIATMTPDPDTQGSGGADGEPSPPDLTPGQQQGGDNTQVGGSADVVNLDNNNDVNIGPEQTVPSLATQAEKHDADSPKVGGGGGGGGGKNRRGKNARRGSAGGRGRGGGWTTFTHGGTHGHGEYGEYHFEDWAMGAGAHTWAMQNPGMAPPHHMGHVSIGSGGMGSGGMGSPTGGGPQHYAAGHNLAMMGPGGAGGTGYPPLSPPLQSQSMVPGAPVGMGVGVGPMPPPPPPHISPPMSSVDMSKWEHQQAFSQAAAFYHGAPGHHPMTHHHHPHALGAGSSPGGPWGPAAGGPPVIGMPPPSGAMSGHSMHRGMGGCGGGTWVGEVGGGGGGSLGPRHPNQHRHPQHQHRHYGHHQPHQRGKLHTVYVRDIHPEVTEHQIEEAFAACGVVMDCRLCTDPNSHGRFAFVAFETLEEAQTALETSGLLVGGHPVQVMPSKTSVIPINPQLLPQTEEEVERCARTVYVANLDHAVWEEEVRGFFLAAAGATSRVVLHGNHRNNTKVAFVEFETAEAATAALGCTGQPIHGRAIRVSPSKTPLRISNGGGGQSSLRNLGFNNSWGSGGSGWGNSAGSEDGGSHPRLSVGSQGSYESFDTGVGLGYAQLLTAKYNGRGAGRRSQGRGPRVSDPGGLKYSGGGGRQASDPKMWHNVHVRNISASLSESALARVFAGCGRVLDCRLCGDSSKLRFAFVAFATAMEVEQALTLDGFVLEGNALKVMRSKTAVIPVNPSLLPQSEADVERCSRTVYVANLDPVLPAAEVRATFEKMCGQVANMHQQLNNRCDAQVAFIEFTEASSAMTALECCGTLIGQRQVRVSPSKTPLKVSPKTARRSRAGDNGGNREARGGAETGVGEAGTWVQDVGDVEDVEGRPSPVDGAAGVGRSVRGDADSDEGDLVVGGGDEDAGGSGDTSPNVVAESSLDDETTILAAAPVHKLALDDSGSTETAVA